MSGVPATKQSQTDEYWAQQVKEANWRISNILGNVGMHNYGASILDVYCQEGILVSRLHDADFEGAFGLETEEGYVRFWEHDNPFAIAGLPTIPFGDDTYDIVSCFGGFDRTDDWDTLTTEMKRVTKSKIFIRPFHDRSLQRRGEMLRFFMDHRLFLDGYNPVHGFYTLRK